MNKRKDWKQIFYDNLPESLSNELIEQNNSDNTIEYLFGWKHKRTKDIIFVVHYTRGISHPAWGIKFYDNFNKKITDKEKAYNMIELKSLLNYYMNK